MTPRVVSKNGREEVRVSVEEYLGHRYLDVRQYHVTADGPLATRKGVTVPLAKLDDFAAAVADVAREARADVHPDGSDGAA